MTQEKKLIVGDANGLVRELYTTDTFTLRTDEYDRKQDKGFQ